MRSHLCDRTCLLIEKLIISVHGKTNYQMKMQKYSHSFVVEKIDGIAGRAKYSSSKWERGGIYHSWIEKGTSMMIRYCCNSGDGISQGKGRATLMRDSNPAISITKLLDTNEPANRTSIESFHQKPSTVWSAPSCDSVRFQLSSVCVIFLMRVITVLFWDWYWLK